MKKSYELPKIIKIIVNTIKYCKLLKNSKLASERAKQKRTKIFKGAPLGEFIGVFTIFLFFASCIIMPLYILSTKYNLINLKIIIANILLLVVLGTKLYFDIKAICNNQESQKTKISIKKEIVIDNLYFWASLYLFTYGSIQLHSSWSKSGADKKTIPKNEIKQLISGTINTFFIVILIFIVVLIITLIFLKSKKNKFEAQEIKKTRSRMKGKYKYAKTRKH